MTEPRSPTEMAAELLELGHYDELADLMALWGGAQEGGRAAPAIKDEVLDSLRVMCEACSESRAEAAWHHEALTRIQTREQDLQQRLKTAIELVSERTEPEDEHQEPAKPSHRIQGSPRSRPSTSADPLASHPLAEGASGSSLSMAVYCLGEFRVYFAGRFVEEWSNGKGKGLFKFLVMASQHRAAKEILMERFWPNAEPHAARNCLNVAIYSLRRAFSRIHPSSVVLFGNDSYYLNPELDVWIDHEAFTAYLTAGRQLERRGQTAKAMHEYRRAEALYQGELLQEDRYEDWPDPLRRTLRDQYLMLLGRLGRHAFEQQDYSACVELCSKMLTVDPCHEEAHHRLMLCWSRQGLSNLALRQYHVCREALGRELEVAPGPATTELFDRIRQGLPV